MPNYVENKLIIHGDESEIKKVIQFLKSNDEETGEEIAIDFNKITPMPKWVFRGNLSAKDEKKYGKENCWYEWSTENWGTKWNAFGLNDDRGLINNNTITFMTAWASVEELIRKLSIIFPLVKLEYYTCDFDDYVNSTGKYVFKDYEILEKIEPVMNSDKAIEIFNFVVKELNVKAVYCKKCNNLRKMNLNDDICDECEDGEER